MPARFCECRGCPACGTQATTHGALFSMDSTGTRKCPPCQAEATKRRNTDPPGRPSAAARGYGADWRRVSAEVIAAATVCHWCGGPPVPGDPFTADHIVPKARGGTNDKSNLVPAHRSCNSRRGGQMRRKTRH